MCSSLILFIVLNAPEFEFLKSIALIAAMDDERESLIIGMLLFWIIREPKHSLSFFIISESCEGGADKIEIVGT